MDVIRKGISPRSVHFGMWPSQKPILSFVGFFIMGLIDDDDNGNDYDDDDGHEGDDEDEDDRGVQRLLTSLSRVTMTGGTSCQHLHRDDDDEDYDQDDDADDNDQDKDDDDADDHHEDDQDDDQDYHQNDQDHDFFSLDPSLKVSKYRKVNLGYVRCI